MKMLDEDEMIKHRDKLLKQCRERGIETPRTNRDVFEDIENLEAALGLATDAPAGKPGDPKAASSGSSLVNQYNAITDHGEKARFLAANERELRELVMHGESPKPGPDIVATYNAITDPAERSKFVARNFQALRAILK
jgi:hypothetical protein